MPPQAAAAATQQGDICRHSQLPTRTKMSATSRCASGSPWTASPRRRGYASGSATARPATSPATSSPRPFGAAAAPCDAAPGPVLPDDDDATAEAAESAGGGQEAREGHPQGPPELRPHAQPATWHKALSAYTVNFLLIKFLVVQKGMISRERRYSSLGLILM